MLQVAGDGDVGYRVGESLLSFPLVHVARGSLSFELTQRASVVKDAQLALILTSIYDDPSYRDARAVPAPCHGRQAVGREGSRRAARLPKCNSSTTQRRRHFGESRRRSRDNGVRVLAVAPPRSAEAPLPQPIGESTARILGAVAIVGIGLIHILDAAGTYHCTRWIFWAYLALIVAAIPVALCLLHWSSPLAWMGAAGLAAGPFAAYLWSRSVGLPGDAPDIGNWLCTLGMAALFVEASLLALSATRLTVSTRSR